MDSKKGLKIPLYTIVFDELDRQKFVVIGETKDLTRFYSWNVWATRGRIENGLIQLEKIKVKGKCLVKVFLIANFLKFSMFYLKYIQD